jgi:hypothetical protein
MEDRLKQVFDKHSPEVGSLALSLREIIREVHPVFKQDVSVALSNLYFKAPKVVCALSLHRRYVNLHFYRGSELADPHNALLGSGKKLRHLKFVPGEQPDVALIREYVLAALALESADSK